LASAGPITGTRSAERPVQYKSAKTPNGIDVIFNDELPAPIDVTDTAWFRALQANQQSFRFGLNRINDPALLETFHELDAKGPDNEQSDMLADIEELAHDSSLNETTRLSLINARKGQGRFRDDLEQRWENACAVLGCAILTILRASHVKPWRQSSHAERLDPANGLLLTAHLDALFDGGLISFRDDGRMLVSNELPRRDRSAFQLPSSLRKKPTQSEKKYLAYHRKHCFKL
jgi:hypothetical protein